MTLLATCYLTVNHSVLVTCWFLDLSTKQYLAFRLGGEPDSYELHKACLYFCVGISYLIPLCVQEV